MTLPYLKQELVAVEAADGARLPSPLDPNCRQQGSYLEELGIGRLK